MFEPSTLSPCATKPQTIEPEPALGDHRLELREGTKSYPWERAGNNTMAGGEGAPPRSQQSRQDSKTQPHGSWRANLRRPERMPDSYPLLSVRREPRNSTGMSPRAHRTGKSWKGTSWSQKKGNGAKIRLSQRQRRLWCLRVNDRHKRPKPSWGFIF